MGVTCLVVGACGFIGSHLVDHLLRKTTWDVIAWDAMTYAAENGRRLEQIGALRNPRFAFQKLDIAVHALLLDEQEVDYIVNLAAETHVDRSIADPGPFFMSNILGTYNLLNLLRRTSAKKFLQFSTDEVFGPADGNTFSEDSRHNPSNPYSATKSAGDSLATAWANTYKLPIVTSHCCNVIGERQFCEKYVPKLIDQISRGETVQVHAREDGVDGSRMYVYAGDVARAIVLMLEHGETGTKYNIPGVEVSNLKMAQMVADIMGKPLRARITYPYKERPGWDFSYRITGERLRELGWEPSSNFDAVLRKIVESYL